MLPLRRAWCSASLQWVCWLELRRAFSELGGVLIVPGLMLASGMTIANATASSLVSVTIFGATTSVNYAISGLVDGRLTLLLLAGGGVGGIVGIRLSKWLAGSPRTARIVLAIIILAASVFVAMQAGRNLWHT